MHMDDAYGDSTTTTPKSIKTTYVVVNVLLQFESFSMPFSLTFYYYLR
jgi:hypothetical protein